MKTLIINRFYFIFLVLILLTFLFTRFYQISKTPASLYWDEASIGYNAYSVLTSGKDEWGSSFPLNFRAFGEFKLPVYIYSVVFSEDLFGVNALAVRLPALVFSLITVVLTFLLALRLSSNKLTALLSTFFLVISPWFFIFSRVGYEANAGLMFFVLGAYLLLFGKEKGWFLLLSAISFGLSMYSYNSFRVVVPLVTLFLLVYVVFFFRETLMKYKKNIILSLFVLVIFALPIIRSYVNGSADTRFQTVSILPESSSKVELLKVFVRNYFSHFSPDFLFLNGDTQTRMIIGGWGELLIIELPFLIFGFLVVLLKKKPELYLLVLLLLIAPIPAAITKESPHSLRTVLMIIPLSIFIAFGVEWFLSKIKNNLWRISILGLVVVLSSLSFGFYFKDFIQNYNLNYSQDWQYPYKLIYTNYSPLISHSKRVVVSDYYAQPYIFALFYQKYDPKEFRQSVSYNSPSDWGFSTVSSFGKFVFPKQVNIDKIKKEGDLVFSAQELVKDKQNEVGVIDFLSGKSAFWIYKF